MQPSNESANGESSTGRSSITRRRTLSIAGSTLAIAGCLGDDDGDGDNATDDAGDGTGDDGTNGTDGDSDGDGEPLADVPSALSLEPIVEGVERPVSMAVAPDQGLQYVVEQPGRIVGLDDSGLLDQPVLDVTDAVVSEGNEQGLLGLAFHPDFSNDRLAYVRYSAPSREGTPEDWSHTFVLSAFEVSEDGTQFDPDSERTILEIPEPQGNHNAGDVAFGPDGFLYVPVGDGGAANDQGPGHVEDWYDAVDGGNGQDVTENLLGSILRIDVDGGDPYAIPEDNPLVGEPGLDEHYAWGLRNPWGVSWDGEDFYVADVGQASYEEIDPVEAGGNYGWNVKEGTHCFEAEECPDATPSDVRGGESLIDPVVEYSHSGDGITGVSVIGGHVYRGDAIPELEGTYVFGDLQARNRLFVAAPGGEGDRWPMGTVATREGELQTLYALGRDPDGELYVLGAGAEGSGMVWRIVADG